MPSLKDIGIFEDSHDDEDVFGAEVDFHNLDSTFQVSPIPTTRIHKDHPLQQVIRYFHSTPQTRRMTNNLEEHGSVGTDILRTDHKDLQNCLFACFLSQMEPKKELWLHLKPESCGNWVKSLEEMRIRSPDRLLSFPSGLLLEMVPPKNLDERNSLVPHDSILTIQNSLREVTRKTVPVETPNSSALVPCDGLGGCDWSNQDEVRSTNYALMAYFTSSASSSDSE
nr:hypothetical protein [Tanacetum cinerariifolium]